MPKYGVRFTEPYLNVRAFGAKGDGRANDGGPIQAAINEAYAMGGHTVMVPPGIYLIKTVLTLSYKVNLVGATPVPYTNGDVILTNPVRGRSTIRLANGSNCRMLQGDTVNGPVSQDATIRWQRSSIANIQFDGNANNQSGTDTEGLYFANIFGLNIQGCAVDFTRSHNIYFSHCNGVHVVDTHATSGGSVAASKSCLYAADFTDSQVRGCQMGGSKGPVARFGTADGVKSLVEGNFFFNSAESCGLYLVDVDYMQVIGNRCDQNYTNGIEVETSEYCLIMGNLCDENGFTNESGGSGIVLTTAPNTAVVGNVCTEGGSASANQDTGIVVGANCDYTTLTGNIVRGNDSATITISATGNDNVRAQGNPGFTDQ